MVSREVIKFFSKLSGKELEAFLQNHANEIKELTGSANTAVEELKSVLQSGEFAEKGENRTCSFFGDKKVFACLKSNVPSKKPTILYTKKVEQQVRRLNNKLISKGARVAKIYSLFFADSKYIEVQQRIKGKPLAISNINNFSEAVVGRSIDVSLKAYTPEEKEKIGEALYKYNLTQQQKMLKTPQEYYDRLYKTVEILANHGIPFYDCHSENVLLGEKGFTIIDLNYQTALEERQYNGNVKSDLTNIFYFLNPFSFAGYYQFFFNEAQQQTLNNNNVEILKKLINAISNNKVVCDFDSFKIADIVYGMIGTENFSKNLKYVFESQNNLRAARGLPCEPLVSGERKLKR